MIKVEIVADSINQQNDRLTSMVLTYPRIIHSEMMTHRMFSRNASSSRAVPVDKMIKAVRENTFCPFEFQKAHKGMQGSEYFTDKDKQECINLWLESAELALQQAEKMKAKGISKQIINRILEPYQYYTVLITGSKEGWENFFSLRCPQYSISELIDGDNRVFKSRKDFLKELDYEPIFPDSDLDWLKINKGQAEIHMMALAEAIWDAYSESTPKVLKAGEWHIPFDDRIDENKLDRDLGWLDLQDLAENADLEYSIWLNHNKIKISTSLAARTSYTTVGNEKEIGYEKMIELHDRLIAQDPPHSSPMEHCCVCVADEDYNKSFKGEEEGWFRNYKGFKSYRQIIEESK